MEEYIFCIDDIGDFFYIEKVDSSSGIILKGTRPYWFLDEDTVGFYRSSFIWGIEEALILY